MWYYWSFNYIALQFCKWPRHFPQDLSRNIKSYTKRTRIKFKLRSGTSRWVKQFVALISMYGPNVNWQRDGIFGKCSLKKTVHGKCKILMAKKEWHATRSRRCVRVLWLAKTRSLVLLGLVDRHTSANPGEARAPSVVKSWTGCLYWFSAPVSRGVRSRCSCKAIPTATY
jgi:hypothetical protein